MIAAFALIATAAVAQEKEYTFKVTASEVNTIGKALGKLTYDEVAALVQKLRVQIEAQNQPPKIEELPKVEEKKPE